MLGDDPGHDARALAAKADKLWAYHSHQQPNAVATVAVAGSDEEEESQIAAVRGAAKSRPQRSGQSGSGGNKKGGSGTGKGAGPANHCEAVPPATDGRLTSLGYCWASELPPKTTATHPQQSWYSGAGSQSQASSLTAPSRRRHHSWRHSRMSSQSPLARGLMQKWRLPCRPSSWRRNLYIYGRAEVYRPCRRHTRSPSR